MIADEVGIIAHPRRHPEDRIFLDVEERLGGALLRLHLAAVVEFRGQHRAVTAYRSETARSGDQDFGAAGSFDLAGDFAVLDVYYGDRSRRSNVSHQHEAAVRRRRELRTVGN